MLHDALENLRLRSSSVHRCWNASDLIGACRQCFGIWSPVPSAIAFSAGAKPSLEGHSKEEGCHPAERDQRCDYDHDENERHGPKIGAVGALHIFTLLICTGHRGFRDHQIALFREHVCYSPRALPALLRALVAGSSRPPLLSSRSEALRSMRHRHG